MAIQRKKPANNGQPMPKRQPIIGSSGQLEEEPLTLTGRAPANWSPPKRQIDTLELTPKQRGMQTERLLLAEEPEKLPALVLEKLRDARRAHLKWVAGASGAVGKPESLKNWLNPSEDMPPEARALVRYRANLTPKKIELIKIRLEEMKNSIGRHHAAVQAALKVKYPQETRGSFTGENRANFLAHPKVFAALTAERRTPEQERFVAGIRNKLKPLHRKPTWTDEEYQKAKANRKLFEHALSGTIDGLPAKERENAVNAIISWLRTN